MKKIQISTVEMTSNAQVIVLNSHIVVRAIKAAIYAKRALNDVKQISQERDENGDWIDKKDDNGNPIYEYMYQSIGEDGAEMLVEEVLPFLQDLSDALEEGE